MKKQRHHDATKQVQSTRTTGLLQRVGLAVQEDRQRVKQKARAANDLVPARRLSLDWDKARAKVPKQGRRRPKVLGKALNRLVRHGKKKEERLSRPPQEQIEKEVQMMEEKSWMFGVLPSFIAVDTTSREEEDLSSTWGSSLSFTVRGDHQSLTFSRQHSLTSDPVVVNSTTNNKAKKMDKIRNETVTAPSTMMEQDSTASPTPSRPFRKPLMQKARFLPDPGSDFME